MGWVVLPSRVRSLRMRPVTLENLKPWPEKPQAKCTRSLSGWRSMTKWPSVELVYLQTLMASMGPNAPGR